MLETYFVFFETQTGNVFVQVPALSAAEATKEAKGIVEDPTSVWSMTLLAEECTVEE